MTAYYILDSLLIIRDGCFNTSQLIFAFEYFTLSKIMPYILKEEEVPKEVTKYDDKVFKTLLFLNILAPICYGVFFTARMYEIIVEENMDAAHKLVLP